MCCLKAAASEIVFRLTDVYVGGLVAHPYTALAWGRRLPAAVGGCFKVVFISELLYLFIWNHRRRQSSCRDSTESSSVPFSQLPRQAHRTAHRAFAQAKPVRLLEQ